MHSKLQHTSGSRGSHSLGAPWLLKGGTVAAAGAPSRDLLLAALAGALALALKVRRPKDRTALAALAALALALAPAAPAAPAALTLALAALTALTLAALAQTLTVAWVAHARTSADRWW